MESSGFLCRETGDYVVATPVTPRAMENVLFNERYFTMVFQNGNGMSRYIDPSGHFTTIIEGTNEPGFMTCTRLIYIRDDDTGQYWNVGYHPVCRPAQTYQCRHGVDQTRIISAADGIEATWRLFVPAGDDPLELWTLTLMNRGPAPRRVSVFAVVELSLAGSASLYGHVSYLHSLLLAKANGVAARKAAMDQPHPFYGAIFLSSRALASRDGRMDAFTGQFRTLANPVAVERGECEGAISSRDRIAGVLHCRLTLPQAGEERVDFLVGAVDVHRVEEEALSYQEKYLRDGGRSVDDALALTRCAIEAGLARNRFASPDYRFDALHNRWLPRLIEFGVTHCRCGGFGYRDIVQQAQGAVMLGSAAKSRARLEQAFTYQYANGYAVRSFPVVHQDSRMKYADSAFWLVTALSEYLKETGDFDLLARRLPYLDKGEGTVWEHLERAMTALGEGRGPHGLCLIHEGDWNDSLTHVGRNGIGESVMLSQSYCYACLLMEELAAFDGRNAAAGEYRAEYEEMKGNLNTHCWDGEWYVRAFDDHGDVIGSRLNSEGKIFLNPQSWALLSRTAPADRADSLLHSIRRYLHTPYGYLLHYPTYTRIQENIGRLTCLEPGCSENASVYTHGNAFLTLALYSQGLPDEAFQVLQLIAPYNPDNPSASVLPYQFSNGYGGPDHRYEPGRSQYGWMTGSGSWLYLAVLDCLFGARKSYDGLRLQPGLPAGWGEVSLRREFRGSVYEISYRRAGAGQTLVNLSVDGTDYDSRRPLPMERGRRYRVEAEVG